MTTKADESVEIGEVSTHEVLDIQRVGSPVVDVREPEESADGHIPGAVNIPLARLEVEVDTHPFVVEQEGETRSLRERPVVLYCLSGGRSARAAAALHRRGAGLIRNSRRAVPAAFPA